MNSKHNGAERQFHHLKGSWYAAENIHDRRLDSITMGFYHPDGGTSGEFSMHWEPLGGKVVNRLEVFYDAWDALYEFRDVMEKLREFDDEVITAETLMEILLSCGVKDATQRTYPRTERMGQ